MKILDLIEALKRYGIEVQSIGNVGGSIVYTLKGRLPEFPFRSRHTSYDLVAAGKDDFIGLDQIEALLLHFWQGQVVLGDNDGR